MNSNKRGRLFWLLAILLCLCACQAENAEITPPEQASAQEKTPEQVLAEQAIDDTHDAFLVDTGGRLGTLLITVERSDQMKNEFAYDAAFYVWDPAEAEEPLQTFTCEVLNGWGIHEVTDADFDGYQDFGYLYCLGNQPSYWHFWLWDEAQGQFISYEALSEISAPTFDAEKQIVTGWARDSAESGVETFYRWIDGALSLVRRINYHYPDLEEETQLITVDDAVDGQMVEVYRHEIDLSETKLTDPRLDERWYDLDYHGA